MAVQVRVEREAESVNVAHAPGARLGRGARTVFAEALGTQKLLFYAVVGSITTSHFGKFLDRLKLPKYFVNFFFVRETPVS